eukprot:CAMPEP_0184478144 /NCGR_PEP_ID=MMETSP0113_2-20130426/256_1 /TAXON_ID=91329 /ORGANISM="Norrisiella sphaerica, Strain BC52" /LENGTH=335 /DNA_ID=CAMNT_0026855833 /DNA_START=34 /DNA_END=1041 /DNA_ORIENTATION=-
MAATTSVSTFSSCTLLALTMGLVASANAGVAVRSAGFTPRTLTKRADKGAQLRLRSAATRSRVEHENVDTYYSPQKLQTKNKAPLSNIVKTLATTAVASAAVPGLALAKGGEFGALEGGVPALVHPVMMVGLYATTLYAGFLGWQIRRTRTLADDISDLKKLAPSLSTPGKKYQSPVGPLIESLKGELASADESTKSSLESDISKLQAFKSTDDQIQALTAERKNLVKGDFRDKHFQLSSLLLALGVGIGIEGPVNTWMRTGKLFPGPHLFAGAGIVVLWAAAAALVPAMQKGSKLAKDLHVALNAANVGLFTWQIATGIPIVQKVLEIKFGIKL